MARNCTVRLKAAAALAALLAAAALSGCGRKVPPAAPATLAVASDLHYVGEAIEDGGELFTRVVEEGEVFSVFASPKEELTRSFIKTTSNLQKIEELIAAKSPVVALKPGERIVRLSYVERNASEPLISTMTKKYGVILNIIFADIEIVQNAPIGGTVGILSGPQDKMDEALEDLRSKNVGVEVILDAGDSESVSA